MSAGVDVEALEAAMDETVAGLMLTNTTPWDCLMRTSRESRRLSIAKAGCSTTTAQTPTPFSVPQDRETWGLTYFINLHKTFGTPHGGEVLVPVLLQ